MKIIRENKLLLLWWAVAYATAFYCFGSSPIPLPPQINGKKSDTINYFSFSKEQKDELGLYFEHKNSKNKFNGVVLVGQKDSIFFSNSYGFANYELKDTLNLNSAFQLASVSKQFTAVAILQLYQRGLLNLTDSVQKFYPNFPYEGITIHQLLTHRSGLANYIYFMQYLPTTYDTILTNQDIARELIEKKPSAYYRPNKRYHYSNTGYVLLAAIVEKVTGLSFSEYLQKNIFTPLKMESSYTINNKATGFHNNSTKGYLYHWREAEDNYLDGVLGDKGIYCSANDLFKWDQGLYKNEIINIDTLNLAFQPMGKPINSKSNYGYGWRMFEWKNDSIKVLFHAGWWHGYKTLLMRIPQDSTTIIVLKNGNTGGSINSKQLLQILYPINLPIIDTLEVVDDD